MQVVLVMFRADGARRSFPLTRDVTIIGRREDCDLRIPLTDVSRKHCRLVKDPQGLRIEDLGSSNGTYQNGTRIQESVIQPGDHIQIGPVGFVVQIDGLPTDAAIRPPVKEEAADEAAPPAVEPADAESSSAGAELTDSDLGETVESHSSEPPARSARPARPAAPTDDDFDVAADDELKVEDDDDIVDLGVSPADDKQKL